MDKEIAEKEKKLEHLKIEHEMEDEKAAIVEKKALEAKLKKEYGRDWKKILGYVGKLKPNREAIESLYSINPELRSLAKPPKMNLR